MAFLVFGGWPANNETWAYDGDTWLQLTTTGAPPARTSASMGYDSRRPCLCTYFLAGLVPWIDSMWHCTQTFPGSGFPSTSRMCCRQAMAGADFWLR